VDVCGNSPARLHSDNSSRSVSRYALGKDKQAKTSRPESNVGLQDLTLDGVQKLAREYARLLKKPIGAGLARCAAFFE